MTKKLQAAYQETTNRIVSTFARMEPSNTDNKGPPKLAMGGGGVPVSLLIKLPAASILQ